MPTTTAVPDAGAEVVADLEGVVLSDGRLHAAMSNPTPVPTDAWINARLVTAPSLYCITGMALPSD